ncbi:MAG: biopolymer transporter ExbD [Nodosilinea sp. LVE1205-7]|jgi:biopolymer transport protein ExbD
MNFKTYQNSSTQVSEINLVPMMDVLMTILTFFIIVSMTLSGQQRSLNVTLPSTQAPGTPLDAPDPLVVSLSVAGQIGVNSEIVNEAQLANAISSYVGKNQQGTILLKADRQVSYEQLAQLLSKMQAVGGDRISLAIAPE